MHTANAHNYKAQVYMYKCACTIMILIIYIVYTLAIMDMHAICTHKL